MSTVRRRPVCAWLLALLLAFWGTNAPAADFGRLFHTPMERHTLDRPAASTVDHDGPRADPMSRRIDGLLRSSDGRATIWLDAEPLAPAPLFRLTPYPGLELAPRSAPQLRLHVGDSWPPPPPSTGDGVPRIHIHLRSPARQ